MRLFCLVTVLLGLITCLGFAQGVPTVPDHVVISEIQADSVDGTGGTKDDWIELYNPTDNPINLATAPYRIEKSTGSGDPAIAIRIGNGSDGTFPGGITIPARGFYLIVDNDATDTDLKNAADALITKSFALSDNYVVYLGTATISGSTDPDIVDFVGYGTAADHEGATPALNPPDGGSIQRKALGLGYAPAQDTDDNSADFEIRDTPTPTNSTSVLMDPAPVVVVDGAGDFKGGFGAIQAAVDAAGSGDIINVAAGTYVEDPVIDKELTLSGPNVAISPNTGTRVTEAILVGTITFTGVNNNVTIQGFNFSYVPATMEHSILSNTFLAGDNLVIQNNSFTATTPSSGANETAIYIRDPNGERTGWVFDDNLVTGYRGMFIWGAASGAAYVSDVTITNNVVGGNSETPAFAGISVDGVSGVISGNVISYTNYSINVGGENAACDGLTISNNTVTHAANTGIGMWSTCIHITITGNTLTDSYDGIIIWDIGGAALGSGIAVNLNNITGNSNYGVLNSAASGILDAENNWWGTNAPTQGTEFSANVDADPWIQFVLKADQNRVVVGGDSALTARLQNSDDEVPTGIDQLPLYQGAKKAGFETDLGRVGSSAITKDLVNGEATATLTSTDSGTATVTVQAKDTGDNPINGAQDTTTVEFLAGASASIGLTANPLNILADGSSTSTITATVRDGYGNLVEDGTDVSFTTDRGTMASTHPTTNGVAQATLTAGTETGVATINVQVNGASADIAVFLKEPGGANVCSAKTEKTEPGDDTVDAKAETNCEIDKSGAGTPTITSARYGENPGGTPIFSPFAGSYFDVYLDDTTDVDEIVIRFYYPKDVDESSLVMYWWDGAYWQICSNYWVNTTDTNGYGGYMAARITTNSTPSLADLSGQAFAAGVAAESVFEHRYYDKSGYWMISLPFNPDPTDPVQLEDDLGAGAPICTYDPAEGDYVTPTELQMGQAYWAWFEGTTDIDATGHKLGTSPQRIDCGTTGWHMIGPAYLRHSSETTCWGEVWVEHNGETVRSVSQAAERGWMKPFVIRYDPDVSEDYYYWCGYDDALLVPWEGYWVMTLLPNVTLQFHFIPAPPLSALALDDPQAMGFQPAEADTPLPPAPPSWTSETGGQWWVTTAVGADAAQFQVMGPLASHVNAIRLQVFDLSSHRIYEQGVSGRELVWPYASSSGKRVASGVYLVQLWVKISGIWEAGELMKVLILR